VARFDWRLASQLGRSLAYKPFFTLHPQDRLSPRGFPGVRAALVSLCIAAIVYNYDMMPGECDLLRALRVNHRLHLSFPAQHHTPPPLYRLIVVLVLAATTVVYRGG